MMNLLNTDIEAMFNRLRGIPRLPSIILNAAEKIYRLYKLNSLDHDLEALREATASALHALEQLATRLDVGEARLTELEALVARHERATADFQIAPQLTVATEE